MPLAPNLLLQAATQAKTQAASANPLANAPEPGDKASSFAQVYAKESTNKPQNANDGALKTARDKASDSAAKKDVAGNKAAAPEPAVADSGKSLPADKATAGDDKAASNGSATDDAAQADSTPVDPTLDPAVLQAAQALPAPVVLAEVAPAPVVTQPAVEAAPLVAVVAASAAPMVAAEPEFDPEADPLDALPAVRLAMEHGGHVSAASQSQPKAAPTASAEAEPTSAQNFANGMASMLDAQSSKDSTEQGGEKAFSGLIDDGLKDLKSASSDTRVDDFANRLAALTQAATPKTANAVPVNQPLAMHQSGWTEEVVNRVMYLSATNLKSAEIQLQPAELGRLDIRVNMVPDQQTQVSFMSAHAGVREALEGQMHRLREMFTQQGMGQVDVNVSDQSRGWQGQEQAQQGQSRNGGGNASGGLLDAADDETPQGIADIAASSTVVGSSAVDYYA